MENTFFSALTTTYLYVASNGDFVSKVNGIDRHGYKLTAEEAIAMAGITEAFMKEKNKDKKMQKHE